MKSTRKILIGGMGALLILCLVGCGSSSGTLGGSNPATSSQNAASAVAAMFGGGAITNLSVKVAEYEEPVSEGSTCDIIMSEEADHDHPEIVDDTYGEPDFYGSIDYGISVSEEDFCTLPNETENEGDGPDSLGLVATFELEGDIEGNCQNDDESPSTIVMQVGSFGVWRQTEATDSAVARSPEIHGHFYILEGDEEMELDCTIYLDENEVATFADCSDVDGNNVVQDSSASCSFAAE